MKIDVNLIEGPFVMEAKNAEGISLVIDASPAIGGKGKGMRPMELLASSLAGCMAIDVLSILRKQRQDVTHFEIEVDGTRKETIPASFEEITLVFSVNKEVDLGKLESAVKLTHEKYCSVSQSLHPSIRVNTKVKHQSK